MKAQVLLPKIFDYPFTYNLKQLKIKTGDIVEVPFGSKNEFGVIWKIIIEPKNIKIKRYK